MNQKKSRIMDDEPRKLTTNELFVHLHKDYSKAKYTIGQLESEIAFLESEVKRLNNELESKI